MLPVLCKSKSYSSSFKLNLLYTSSVIKILLSEINKFSMSWFLIKKCFPVSLYSIKLFWENAPKSVILLDRFFKLLYLILLILLSILINSFLKYSGSNLKLLLSSKTSLSFNSTASSPSNKALYLTLSNGLSTFPKN